MSQYSVPLKKIVEDLDITVVRKSSDFDTKLIVSTSVDRPALKLAGVYNLLQFPFHIYIHIYILIHLGYFQRQTLYMIIIHFY